MKFTDSLIVPLEGIHADVPNRLYHDDWDAVSRTELVTLKNSTPAVLDERRKHPKHYASEAMLIGSLVDDMYYGGTVLTSELYALAPDGFNLRSNANKNFAAEVAASGRRLVKADQWELAAAMFDALQASELARFYLGGAQCITEPVGPQDAAEPADEDGKIALIGQTRPLPDPGVLWQPSAVWKDPDTGVLCKCRPDTVLDHSAIIVDLKTTADSSPDGFRRAAEQGEYHWQAAYYLQGMTAAHHAEYAVEKQYDEFMWVVVSRDKPHRVEVYRCGEAELQTGHSEVAGALRMFKACSDSGNWPTSSGVVQTLHFGPWKLK